MDAARYRARVTPSRASLPAVLLTALALAAGCGDDGRDPAPPPAAASTPAPTTPPAAPELRIADLIDRLGCDGGVIETQLYSKETGRCKLGAAEITIATFGGDALRDQWLDFGRQIGGNYVSGPGWAAAASTPDAATTVADKLGGSRL